MPRITFQPLGQTVEVPSGLDLPDAAKQAGIPMDFPCGGQGTCGRCAARVITGRLALSESPVSAETDLPDGYILSCRAKTGTEDVVIDIGEQTDFSLNQSDEEIEDATAVLSEWRSNPPDHRSLIETSSVMVPLPEKGEDGSDMDRLKLAIQQVSDHSVIDFSLNAMRQAADALRKTAGNVTVAAIPDEHCRKVIHIEAAEGARPSYGIAVDLGTTTVAVRLVCLPEGRIAATRADYNLQVSCGLDVISRINYARRPGGLEELRSKALKTINALIGKVIKATCTAEDRIFCCALSGNTTMIHLLLGMNPEYIRLAPYTPTILDVPAIPAGEIGLHIHPEGPVFISPAIGSYVGGDITAGLLCTDLIGGSNEINLFMDIGTNGEVVVGNRDFLLTCACSAGPAFEGGGIRNGMRATSGAIDKIAIDPESGEPFCRTIGNIKPRGICGSGMLSLLAGLFRGGWIDGAGRFTRPSESPFIDIKGRVGTYTLVPSGERPIVISERDIETLIRSKAAIYAACALMLKQADADFNDMANIYIAGGFGRHLDIEDAVSVGLLPDIPRDRFRYLGNASLKGTTMILLSERHRILQKETAKRMTYVELNTDPEYMDQYTGALFLPHTDSRRFPSIARP